MQTMDDALLELVESGRVTAKTAMSKATEKARFEALAKKEERAAAPAQAQVLNRCRRSSHAAQFHTRYRDLTYSYWLRFGYFFSANLGSGMFRPGVRTRKTAHKSL